MKLNKQAPQALLLYWEEHNRGLSIIGFDCICCGLVNTECQSPRSRDAFPIDWRGQMRVSWFLLGYIMLQIRTEFVPKPLLTHSLLPSRSVHSSLFLFFKNNKNNTQSLIFSMGNFLAWHDGDLKIMKWEELTCSGQRTLAL